MAEGADSKNKVVRLYIGNIHSYVIEWEWGVPRRYMYCRGHCNTSTARLLTDSEEQEEISKWDKSNCWQKGSE